MASIIKTKQNASLLSSQSMGASFASSALKIQDIEGLAIQVSWSGGGTPVGVLQLQASNSIQDDSNAIWDDMVDSAYSLSGNSGHITFNVSDQHFYMIRLSYTRTSGTATMSATYNLRSRES